GRRGARDSRHRRHRAGRLRLRLFRVLPYLAAAGEREPGGPLYMPPQGGGRMDNPAFYSVLYLSDAPAGAISEAFGRFPEWSPAILRGRPDMPGSVQALASYELPKTARICNLDDTAQLLALRLRPSDVVTRDYVVSRAWALAIFRRKKWAGVCWWSYYDPR